MQEDDKSMVTRVFKVGLIFAQQTCATGTLLKCAKYK
jgi:hypothetical protein